MNREIRQEARGAQSAALTVIIAGIFSEQWLREIEAVAAEWRQSIRESGVDSTEQAAGDINPTITRRLSPQ